MYKQVIVVRKDLKMDKGKLSAQVAHASISAAKHASEDVLKKWERRGQKKVVLKVDNLDGLLDVKKKCDEAGIKNKLVSDAGLTQLEPGTKTALGIGPESEEKIDKVTGSLKLL